MERPTSGAWQDDQVLAAMWVQAADRGLSATQMKHVFEMGVREGRRRQREVHEAETRCRHCTGVIWWMGDYSRWVHADSWTHVCDPSTHEPLAEPHPRYDNADTQAAQVSP